MECIIFYFHKLSLSIQNSISSHTTLFAQDSLHCLFNQVDTLPELFSRLRCPGNAIRIGRYFTWNHSKNSIFGKTVFTSSRRSFKAIIRMTEAVDWLPFFPKSSAVTTAKAAEERKFFQRWLRGLRKQRYPVVIDGGFQGGLWQRSSLCHNNLFLRRLPIVKKIYWNFSIRTIL